MLSQGFGLRTLFVPDAVSETVAPQSIRHYLSQRRRWGSNAYFNNFYYLAGSRMNPITRLLSAIDIARETFVYYRILNTVFFIKALVDHFVFLEILPLIILGQLPLVWYFICMLLERELRIRMHKLLIGFLINKLISPFMALMIFTEVAFNLGNNGMFSLLSVLSIFEPQMLTVSAIKQSGVCRASRPPRRLPRPLRTRSATRRTSRSSATPRRAAAAPSAASSSPSRAATSVRDPPGLRSCKNNGVMSKKNHRRVPLFKYPILLSKFFFTSTTSLLFSHVKLFSRWVRGSRRMD